MKAKKQKAEQRPQPKAAKSRAAGGSSKFQKSSARKVRTPPGSAPNADKRYSTPVTRKDYESPEMASPSEDKSELPRGDAG
jgi:hypothetical protein